MKNAQYHWSQRGCGIPWSWSCRQFEVQVTLEVQGQLLRTTKRQEEGKGRQRWCSEDNGSTLVSLALTKATPGRKGFFPLTVCRLSPRKAEAGRQGKTLKQTPRRRTSLPSLFSSLYSPGPPAQGLPTHNALAHLQQLAIKKMPAQTYSQLNLTEAICQWWSLFPKWLRVVSNWQVPMLATPCIYLMQS